ncbi:MAG: hypothetical protein HOE90_20250 [Bacteriovoracaceae bacterium]|nr:hypothetical protein [Bacteriovoracaceae bacterium]
MRYKVLFFTLILISAFAQVVDPTPSPTVEAGEDTLFLGGNGWGAIVTFEDVDGSKKASTQLYLEEELISDLHSGENIDTEKQATPIVVKKKGDGQKAAEFGDFLYDQVKPYDPLYLQIEPQKEFVKFFEQFLENLTDNISEIAQDYYGIGSVDCADCTINSQLGTLDNVELDGLELLSNAVEGAALSGLEGDITSDFVMFGFSRALWDSNSAIEETLSKPGGQATMLTLGGAGALAYYSLGHIVGNPAVLDLSVPLIENSLICENGDYICIDRLDTDPEYARMLKSTFYVYFEKNGFENPREIADILFRAIKTGNFGNTPEQRDKTLGLLTEFYYSKILLPEYLKESFSKKYHDHIIAKLGRSETREGVDLLEVHFRKKYEEIGTSWDQKIFNEKVKVILYQLGTDTLTAENQAIFDEAFKGNEDELAVIVESLFIDLGEFSVVGERLGAIAKKKAITFMKPKQAREYLYDEYYPNSVEKVREEQREKLSQAYQRQAKKKSGGNESTQARLYSIFMENIDAELEKDQYEKAREKKAKRLTMKKVRASTQRRGQLDLEIDMKSSYEDSIFGGEDTVTAHMGFPQKAVLGLHYHNDVQGSGAKLYVSGYKASVQNLPGGKQNTSSSNYVSVGAKAYIEFVEVGATLQSGYRENVSETAPAQMYEGTYDKTKAYIKITPFTDESLSIYGLAETTRFDEGVERKAGAKVNYRIVSTDNWKASTFVSAYVYGSGELQGLDTIGETDGEVNAGVTISYRTLTPRFAIDTGFHAGYTAALVVSGGDAYIIGSEDSLYMGLGLTVSRRSFSQVDSSSR